MTVQKHQTVVETYLKDFCGEHDKRSRGCCFRLWSLLLATLFDVQFDFEQKTCVVQLHSSAVKPAKISVANIAVHLFTVVRANLDRNCCGSIGLVQNWF